MPTITGSCLSGDELDKITNFSYSLWELYSSSLLIYFWLVFPLSTLISSFYHLSKLRSNLLVCVAVCVKWGRKKLLQQTDYRGSGNSVWGWGRERCREKVSERGEGRIEEGERRFVMVKPAIGKGGWKWLSERYCDRRTDSIPLSPLQQPH